MTGNEFSALEDNERRLYDLADAATRGACYVASVMSLIYGLTFGLVTMLKCEHADNKRFGKICIVLGVVNAALTVVCAVLYVAAVLVAIAAVIAAGGAANT